MIAGCISSDRTRRGSGGQIARIYSFSELLFIARQKLIGTFCACTVSKIWAQKLRPLPAERRWSEMAAMIPEEVIELFATVGTYDDVPKKLAARYSGLGRYLVLVRAARHRSLGHCKTWSTPPSAFRHITRRTRFRSRGFLRQLARAEEKERMALSRKCPRGVVSRSLFALRIRVGVARSPPREAARYC